MIRITGSVQGLPPTNSSKYGLHVHENSISDNDCMKAGTHFNPLSSDHGAPGGILGMIHFLLMFKAALILETKFLNVELYLSINRVSYW